MDKWFKDIFPDKDPYHNRGRDQMRKKGVWNSSACGKYMINQPVNITYQEAQRRVIIGKYTKNKPVNIIYQKDPQRIIIKCVIILNSNKENSLTTMIIKSINITYLFFKPIIQNES